MEVKQLSVINPLLKKYVDYYYLLNTSNDNSESTYFAYPSVHTPLCFLHKCSIQINPNDTFVKKDEGNDLLAVIVGRSIKPVRISMPQGIQEFCITFKPLGINFIKQNNLGKLLYPGLKETDEFDFLKPSVTLVLHNPEALEVLENQLIQNIRQSNELEQLQQILKIVDMNEAISFQEVSAQLKIPYKTIYRIFYKHLGLSPVQFRKIMKFRTAVEKVINPAYKSKMSAVALESGYFDQAHYTNEFKKIAELTPKDFLSAIWLDQSKKIAWKRE